MNSCGTSKTNLTSFGAINLGSISRRIFDATGTTDTGVERVEVITGSSSDAFPDAGEQVI